MKPLELAAWSLVVFGAGPSFAGEPLPQPPQVATCLMCHDLSKDGMPLVGPPLWGVSGRKPGSLPGFHYSPAMVKYGASGAHWNRATLTAFLTSPQAVVPGTKMGFAGEKSPKVVAQIVNYLLSLR